MRMLKPVEQLRLLDKLLALFRSEACIQQLDRDGRLVAKDHVLRLVDFGKASAPQLSDEAVVADLSAYVAVVLCQCHETSMCCVVLFTESSSGECISSIREISIFGKLFEDDAKRRKRKSLFCLLVF